MKAVPRISKKEEQKLLEELEKISHLVLEKGLDAEDSVVRLVKNGEIHINHLPYIIYSYNNGMAVNIMRNGKTPKEKIASFPIIRLDKVLEKLGLKNTKNLLSQSKQDNNLESNRSTRCIDSIYLTIKYK
jgi:hypothetical protein